MSEDEKFSLRITAGERQFCYSVRIRSLNNWFSTRSLSVLLFRTRRYPTVFFFESVDSSRANLQCGL